MRAFLFWFSGWLPCRIISDGPRPYLERYYLFTLLGWRFYLHRFVASDPDRGLHDHPWRRAFSIILAGWYWEHTRAGVRRVRWFNYLTGDTFHRVVLPVSTRPFCELSERQQCWTLFAHRVGDVKAWGMLRELDHADGVAIFEPYRYKAEGGKPVEWWRTAPKGRNEPRRATR